MLLSTKGRYAVMAMVDLAVVKSDKPVTLAGIAERQEIPLAYLESMFGPRVKEILDLLHSERDKKKRGEKSELMDLLIAYNWNDNFKLEPQHREVFSEHG